MSTSSNTSECVVLDDTCLCAIVQDEIMNPAGGIVDFIESTVPFVAEAVIVDGLSKDGTHEALEEMQAKYPQMRIFDRKFENFSDQRNYSLQQATAKMALVLDADERLTRQDFIDLQQFVANSPQVYNGFPVWGYKFNFLDIYPTAVVKGEGHAIRLFERDKGRFFKTCWEYFFFKNSFHEALHTWISIKHFLPEVELKTLKWNLYYSGFKKNPQCRPPIPSDIPQSKLWKAYNPARELFR